MASVKLSKSKEVLTFLAGPAYKGCQPAAPYALGFGMWHVVQLTGTPSAAHGIQAIPCTLATCVSCTCRQWPQSLETGWRPAAQVLLGAPRTYRAAHDCMSMCAYICTYPLEHCPNATLGTRQRVPAAAAGPPLLSRSEKAGLCPLHARMPHRTHTEPIDVAPG